MSQQGGYYQPPQQQGYYQPQSGYQQVPQQQSGGYPQDVEANKPPPYTSTYVYGEQPQAPPPPQNFNERDNMIPPDDNPGISSFSEKSVRQGLERLFFVSVILQKFTTLCRPRCENLTCLTILYTKFLSFRFYQEGLFDSLLSTFGINRCSLFICIIVSNILFVFIYFELVAVIKLFRFLLFLIIILHV